MDRVLDRAFNRAHGTVHNVVSSAQARSDSKQQQKSREDQLRSLTTPMTADDVVERIDTAFKDGDYYRLLQLPGPQLNSLSKAEWSVSSSELSKAYRKLSILVHPDKAPGEKARQAFEQLKQAYNELRDPERLAARLRDAEPALHKAAERAAAAASMPQRVEMNAVAEERKAKLRQQEVRAWAAAAAAVLGSHNPLNSRRHQQRCHCWQHVAYAACGSCGRCSASGASCDTGTGACANLQHTSMHLMASWLHENHWTRLDDQPTGRLSAAVVAPISRASCCYTTIAQAISLPGQHLALHMLPPAGWHTTASSIQSRRQESRPQQRQW
eukprot:GHRQ01017437.1.p1 GENE.GHRQ01017437.1~~GHRQ01017437.1.p1  ORF type:complete len:327 (+),score=58.39 GHRQ01017437.1:204-1184(+)